MRAALLVPIALVSLLASSRGQAPTYTVRHVGAGWTPSINAHGEVIANELSGSGWRAWYAAPGGAPVYLPLPAGATSCEAREINKNGWIVGQAMGNTFISAVLWRPTGPGAWSVTTLPGTYGAYAVNDLGDVVGKLSPAGGGFHWSEAGGTVPLTPTGFIQLPYDVNNERVVVGGNLRIDLDTLVVVNLGLPSGTGYNYQFVDLSTINDEGRCGGWAAVATSLPDYAQAVRFTDGAGWNAFNLPVPQAGVLGMDGRGDTLFAIGYTSAAYLYLEGQGTIVLGNQLAPGYQSWSVGLTYGGDISAGGEVVCVGSNASSGQSGVVVLTPVGYSPEPLRYCTGKLNSDGCVPAIGWSGIPSASASSGFVVSVSGAVASVNGLLFYSRSGPASVPFQGGLLCAAPPLRRTPLGNSGGSGPCGGTFSLDFAAWVSGGGDPSLGAGSSVWLQHWSRDAQASFPTGLSDALRVTLWP